MRKPTKCWPFNWSGFFSPGLEKLFNQTRSSRFSWLAAFGSGALLWEKSADMNGRLTSLYPCIPAFFCHPWCLYPAGLGGHLKPLYKMATDVAQCFLALLWDGSLCFWCSEAFTFVSARPIMQFLRKYTRRKWPLFFSLFWVFFNTCL